MSEPPSKPPRRRLVLVVVVGAAIFGAIVAVTLLIRSREPERSIASTCTELELAKDLDRALTALDPTTLDARLSALRSAVRYAPSDIEPQIATLTAFVSELVDQVEDSPASQRRDALAEALSQRSAEIDAITEAGDSLQSWTSTNCGFELGESTSPSVP